MKRGVSIRQSAALVTRLDKLTHSSSIRRGERFRVSQRRREGNEVRTRAERVVSTLEELAGLVILALGSDTLEVVRVVLEASKHNDKDGHSASLSRSDRTRTSETHQ